MNNIQAVKIGNVLNISINGKLYKKNCGSHEEADILFKQVLMSKSNPDDDKAVNEIRLMLNEKLRIALLTGIEADVDTGEAYLAGFNTPLPNTLLEVIKEYHENGYPLNPIINFWKLLMINPDKRIRTSLFDFISTHDFVLTDKGYMLVYKAVYIKEKKEDNPFSTFISNQYLHIKKNWKCGANKYVAYKEIASGKLAITKYNTAKDWDEKERGVEILGKVGDLYMAIISAENSEEDIDITYTDMYTKTMSIILGKPVVMPRTECDSDPAIDCSYGLHVGATRYVQSYANKNSTILVCLVNPANVVAVPNYDHSKMRVTEYFPFAVATYENGKIDIVEQKYFEDDYSNYEVDVLEEQIRKLKNEEIPIKTAIGAEIETRSLDELKKIIESRLLDLE